MSVDIFVDVDADSNFDLDLDLNLDPSYVSHLSCPSFMDHLGLRATFIIKSYYYNCQGHRLKRGDHSIPSFFLPQTTTTES